MNFTKSNQFLLKKVCILSTIDRKYSILSQDRSDGSIKPFLWGPWPSFTAKLVREKPREISEKAKVIMKRNKSKKSKRKRRRVGHPNVEKKTDQYFLFFSAYLCVVEQDFSQKIPSRKKSWQCFAIATNFSLLPLCPVFFRT